MCAIHDGLENAFSFFATSQVHVFDFHIQDLGLLRSMRLVAFCQVELTLLQAVAGCQGLGFEEV